MQKSKILGNRFQEDFERSVPKEYLIQRYKDSPIHFKKVYNPADYEIFNGKFLTLIECKTTQELTFPIGNIGRSQLWKMLEIITKRNVFGGFLIEYREIHKCYFVLVEEYIKWFLTRDRESLSMQWVITHGVEVPGRIIVKRYHWNIEFLLKWIEVNCYHV